MTKEELPVIYLNIVVKDPSGAIQGKVDVAVEKSSLPNPLKKAAAKVGGKIATTMATPTVVAKQMSEKLPVDMPVKMKGKGMTVVVETVNLEGPYVVLSLQIQKVDSVVLAEVKALEAESESYFDIVAWLKWTLEKLGASNQQSLEERYLPAVIQSKMPSMMAEMMQEKFGDMGMKAEPTVISEDKQARFFFKKLKEIRSSN
jgi:uncharacterized protein YhdP